jgi:hypothetical protein
MLSKIVPIIEIGGFNKEEDLAFFIFIRLKAERVDG